MGLDNLHFKKVPGDSDAAGLKSYLGILALSKWRRG